MTPDDIILEIHRTREKQAAECGFDPRRIGARMRARQKERAANGQRYVSFAGSPAVVRDEPAKP